MNSNPSPRILPTLEAGIPRRTIVKSAAWTVPVLVASTAVPTAMASGTLILRLGCPTPVVNTQAPLPQPVTAHVTDASGDVVSATVAYAFSSTDGGTVLIDGEAHPGGASAVTGVTGASGEHALTGIVGGSSGTVTLIATATTADGRTATSNSLSIAVSAAAGTLFTWGRNDFGQTGSGSFTNPQRTPIARIDGRKYVGLIGSYLSFAGIAEDGRVYSTGSNVNGCLGMGWWDANASVNPGNKTAQPLGPAGTTERIGQGTPTGVLSNVVAGYTGKGGTLDGAFMVSTADGTFWGAGENAGGGFSRSDGSSGGTSDRDFGYTAYTPIGVNILARNPGRRIVQAALSGWFRSAYLLDDGTVWNAGRNNYAAFGSGAVLAQNKDSYAVQTVDAAGNPLTDIAQITISQRTQMYLDRNGKIWGSGTNSWGRLPGLALDKTQNFASPLTQPAGKDVVNIWSNGNDGGFHIAETVDGMLYVAGANTRGSASIGTTATNLTNVWLPVVGAPADTRIRDVQFGYAGGLWLFEDGTVYFSGLNNTGGLGNGTSSGAQITTMARVPLPGGKKAIAVGATHLDSYAAILEG